MKTRAEILNEVRRQREDITQYFSDVAHWNRTRGKTEGVIDPDPDGRMQRIAEALDACLEKEREHQQ